MNTVNDVEPIIETERLLLRPVEPQDLEAFCAMMMTPEVARFLTTDKKPQSYANAWRGCALMIGHWQIHGFGMFSMIEKETGDWVGRTGPWMPGGWPGLECGWGVVADRWGKGYAPEAAIASIRWIFHKYPDLSRIISVIDPENHGSQAVARKVGERETDDTFLFDEKLELKIWAANREEWFDTFGAN
ncbi:MAG: GNAT family N-acetyltransferase [Pseudomonadota bacterium]